MSDSAARPARPVSLFTIVFLFAIFGAFLLVIRWVYIPAARSTVNAPAENLPKELAWRADSIARRNTLVEARAAELAQASRYGWVDQKAGVVQLPIDRAMELTVQQYGVKK